MNKAKHLFITGLLFSGLANAASYDLSLIAADGSRWYEHDITGAFYELGTSIDDATEPYSGNWVDGAQGAWAINQLPNYIANPGSGGDIGFPTYDLNSIGNISYDDTDLSGAGSESAAITDLSITFEKYLAVRTVDGESINVTVSPYTSTVNSVTGNMLYTDGELTGIDLTADVTLTYQTAFGDLPYNGSFSIDGNMFLLDVDDSNFIDILNQNARYQWDVFGTVDGVSEVPVPAAVWLFASAIAGLAGLKRQRR